MNLFFETPIPVEHDSKGMMLMVGVIQWTEPTHDVVAMCINDDGRLDFWPLSDLDTLWRYDYNKKTWVGVMDQAEPNEAGENA